MRAYPRGGTGLLRPVGAAAPLSSAARRPSYRAREARRSKPTFRARCVDLTERLVPDRPPESALRARGLHTDLWTVLHGK